MTHKHPLKHSGYPLPNVLIPQPLLKFDTSLRRFGVVYRTGGIQNRGAFSGHQFPNFDFPNFHPELLSTTCDPFEWQWHPVEKKSNLKRKGCGFFHFFSSIMHEKRALPAKRARVWLGIPPLPGLLEHVRTNLLIFDDSSPSPDHPPLQPPSPTQSQIRFSTTEITFPPPPSGMILHQFCNCPSCCLRKHLRYYLFVNVCHPYDHPPKVTKDFEVWKRRYRGTDGSTLLLTEIPHP